MRLVLHFLFGIFFTTTTLAQPLSLHFQKVTTAEGLNVGGATAISEDKYGYIWIGTVNGLNRYDGRSMKVYEHRFGDSTSLLPSAVRYAFCDSKGTLWISFMNGLMSYDYARDAFREYGRGKMGWVTHIVEAKPGQLYIGTSEGLVKLQTESGTLTLFDSLNTVGKGWESQVWDIAHYGDKLYLLTRNSLTVFDLNTETHRVITLPDFTKGLSLNKIAINPKGEVWLAGRSDNSPIYRTDLNFQYWEPYKDLMISASGQPNVIFDLMFDRKGRLWVSSTHMGVARYDAATNHFRSTPIEPWARNSVLTAYIGNLYEDRNGLIWCESTKGVCYFNPEDNFFQNISPGNAPGAEDNQLIATAAVERPDGKLWLAGGNGIYLYDPVDKKSLSHYANQAGKAPVLYDNNVRSLWLDRQGDLWVCTLKGVNRLRAGKEQFEFLGEKEGLAVNTYAMSVRQTRDGTIWIGDFSDAGHHYLPPGASRFLSLQEHPALAPHKGYYGHCIFEDSRGRIWFGLDGRGLVFYDPTTQQSRHWERTPDNDRTLVGNYVYAISESSDGKIWAATSMGVSVIDPDRFRFTNYDRARGLPTNRVATLVVDRRDKVWMGTALGLLLFDSTRNVIRQMDRHDGLLSQEFVSVPVSPLRNGQLLFPSRHGFVLFNPDQYEPKAGAPPFMLSQVRVLNQEFNTGINAEALEELFLPPGKNFFSFTMTALHYANPNQIWYAYKMEPYDREWTYTQSRVANYTNVPAGNYTFYFKVSTDRKQWDVPEKQIKVYIGQHWYLSKWLWSMLLIAAAGITLATFRRRARLQKALMSLERKAQALAKEKALVQYENLTQQLNPHFLFNSLASLGSLIRFDPKTASEFLEALSKMYRYILQSRERETVLLREEIAFVEHFLKLQQTRFGAALLVHMDIDAAAEERKIVPVTLQNLMENALKHNTFDEDDPLVVSVSNDLHYLIVRNNLQRRPVVETSNKQGLSRLSQLYQYLSDKPLLIESDEAYFTVKIPLL